MTQTLAPAGSQCVPTAEELAVEWATSPRWQGVARTDRKSVV